MPVIGFIESAGGTGGAVSDGVALAYLAVQYMLALGRSNFIWVLGAGAVAEVPPPDQRRSYA